MKTFALKQRSSRHIKITYSRNIDKVIELRVTPRQGKMKLFCVLLPFFFLNVLAESSDSSYTSTVSITNKHIHIASNYKDALGKNGLECVIEQIVKDNMFSVNNDLIILIAVPEYALTDSEENLNASIKRDKSIQEKISKKIAKTPVPKDSDETKTPVPEDSNEIKIPVPEDSDESNYKFIQ
ncbi:uncharacterized protein LOC126835625 [Adelges cooleyi]|uniref:uncharacterized protein LOC126835625 n=1 Tax=Adelges cooleyi TaxID=133065 RepID=UPI00217FB17C|nr:uncharacterized protein LOC126835625 [Adelges cooleyi]